MARSRDGSAPADYLAAPDLLHLGAYSEQVGCPAGLRWALSVFLEAMRAVAYVRLAEEFVTVARSRDGSAPADFSAALRVGDHSVPAAKLDGLTPAGLSAGPDSLHWEAHSEEQAGCRAGLQTAYWRAGLIFQRLANSPAGFLAGQCSEWPVSPEAPV